MHAYLIVGKDESAKKEAVEKCTKGFTIYESKLEKIEDAKTLNRTTLLRVSKPTAFVIVDIDKASNEALNAFLKNLEEPQKDLRFVLTATSLHSVLPTIVSRCTVIRIQNKKLISKDQGTSDFLNLTVGEKLNHIGKIKERDDAIRLLENTILYFQNELLNTEDHKKITDILKNASEIRQNLLANGNVSLQLTNFVIKIK